MNRTELTAFLGPAADDLDQQTLDALLKVATRLEEKWPTADEQDSRIHALNGAAMIAADDATLNGLAVEWQTLLGRAEEARETLIGAIRWAADGVSQSEISRQTGMTRVTVGKALKP